MKMKLLLMSICFITSLSMMAQMDPQWIVNQTTALHSSNTIHIHGIERPNTTNQPDACNDFFGIFNDGTYFLHNRSNNSHCYGTTSNTPFTYVLQCPDDISYMYLTYRYEEDDPPRNLTIHNDDETNAANRIDLNLTGTNVSHNYITHQSPVDSRDLTFIINPDVCENTTSTYTICYHSDNQDNFTLNSCNFPGRGGNLLYVDGNGNFQESTEDFMSDNCLTITNYYSNTFINFKVNLEEPVGNFNSIYYTIEDENGNVCYNGENQADAILEYHDPNFIELQRVWDDGSKKWAKYRVECYNEKPGHVDSVTLEAILPPQAKMNTVKILEWNQKCDIHCGDAILLESNDATKQIKVRFKEGLDGYHQGIDKCRYTAWFEFSVELEDTTNLYLEPLKAKSPYSYFNEDVYDIVKFIDHWTCKEIEKLPQDVYNDTARYPDSLIGNSRSRFFFNEWNYVQYTDVINSQITEGDTITNTVKEKCYTIRDVYQTGPTSCNCPWYTFSCYGDIHWWKIYLLFGILFLLILILGYLVLRKLV